VPDVACTSSVARGTEVPTPRRLFVGSKKRFASDAIDCVPVKNASCVGTPPEVVTPPPAPAQLPVVKQILAVEPIYPGSSYVIDAEAVDSIVCRKPDPKVDCKAPLLPIINCVTPLEEAVKMSPAFC